MINNDCFNCRWTDLKKQQQKQYHGITYELQKEQELYVLAVKSKYIHTHIHICKYNKK